MKQHLFEAAVGAVLAVTALAAVVASGHIRALWPEPMGPAVYPRIAGATVLLLSLAVAGLSFARALQSADCRYGEAASDEGATPAAVATLAVLVGAYCAAIFVLGYFSATLAFMFAAAVALLRFAGRPLRGPLLTQVAAVTLLLTVLLYVAVRVLRIYVPPVGWF